MSPRVDLTYPSAPLLHREQRHRRILLFGMAWLLALGTSPVFGHHLLPGAEKLLIGRDHLFSLCLVALHMLLFPVHEGFHVLLMVGLGYAIWDRARASMHARRVLSAVQLKRCPPSAALVSASRRAGVEPEDLVVIARLPNPAFTAGWLRPRIFVEESLDRMLDPDELQAVLSHERAHARRRDPLRLSLLRFFACTLFYIPALRKLADDMADEAEIAADDEAARNNPLALASAIIKLAAAPGWAGQKGRFHGSPAIVGFQRDDLLDRRARRLLGEQVFATSHVTRRSLATAGAALTAALISGLIMVHPLPGSTVSGALHSGGPAAAHCVHPHRSPFSHIFCLGSVGRSGTAHCPHGGH